MKKEIIKEYVDNFKKTLYGPLEAINDELIYELIDINKSEFEGLKSMKGDSFDSFDFNTRLRSLIAGILTYDTKINIILDGFNSEKSELINSETRTILNEMLCIRFYQDEDYSIAIKKLEYYQNMMKTNININDFDKEVPELSRLIRREDIYDLLHDDTLKEDIYDCIFSLAIKDNEPYLEYYNEFKI